MCDSTTGRCVQIKTNTTIIISNVFMRTNQKMFMLRASSTQSLLYVASIRMGQGDKLK